MTRRGIVLTGQVFTGQVVAVLLAVGLLAVAGNASSTASKAGQQVPGTSEQAGQQVPGTSEQGTSEQVPGTMRTPDDRPPLVLISIDTLRSDRLPAYGFDGIETPAIDRLRGDGILFERAYSHVPLTLPSHVSMFTGLLPSEHGVRDNQGYAVAATDDFLAQRLRRLGYATAGAVSSYVLHRQSGFGSHGFDLYDDHLDIDPGQQTLGGIDRRGPGTLDAITPWVRQHHRRPFFLFFHIFEPHLPHTPPPALAARYGQTYEAEVAAADAVVGDLLDLLTALDLYDRALILLLSDHGEGLGDHGEEEHGIFLYREALQVPMILKLPANARRGTTIAAPVQLVDVHPTLLHAAGASTPGEASHSSGDGGNHGRALQTVHNDDPARPIYAETYYPRLHYGWSELTSLILRQHHLIAGPAPELFDLQQDPREQHNLLPQQRRRAGALRDLLVELQRPLEAPQEIDQASRRRLEALGYLTTSRLPQADAPLPDPKAKLPSLQDLKRARQLAERGQVDEAVAVYRRLLADNPRLLDGWHALGELLRRVGRFDQAAEAYGQALEVSDGDPDFLAAVLASQIAAGHLQEARDGLAASLLPGSQQLPLERQLAAALARQGKVSDALVVLEGDGHDGDTGSRILRLRLMSEAGQAEEAEQRLSEILSQQPEAAEAHQLLSLLALRRGAWQEAHDAARQAVELDAGLAESWNNLGVAQWYLEQRPAAIESWQRAVAADPTAWDTLYNLGSKAMTLERLDIARDSLQRFVAGAPPDVYEAQLRRARVLLRRLQR